MLSSEILLKGLSLNTAGINNPLKRRLIANFIKQQRSEHICLQEMHLWAQEEKYLKECFKRVIFHTTELVLKKKGVCISLAHKLNWKA